MQILRELWTKESVGRMVHTTYENVVNLRDRLESRVSLAHEKLLSLSKKNKHYYNKKSKQQS